MTDKLIRGAMIVGFVAMGAPAALSQTSDVPPTPPAAEAPVPAPTNPPAPPAPDAPPAAQSTTPPPPAAAPPAATTTAPPAATTPPAPTPPPAAATPPPPQAPVPQQSQSEPEPQPPAAAAEPAGETLPEVTVQQRQPIKQIAGPPVADTEVQIAPGPVVGSSGTAAATTTGGPATGTGGGGSGASSGLTLGKVPGAVSRVTSDQIIEDRTLQVQDTLQKQVPGIILTDTAGGGLRPDIQFRGFDASPIGGRSQAIAVYQNGVRINEAFGDTVNLDLIPAIAISDMTILGANPLYGLNAIGGAIGITMKDGFSFQGGTIDAMGGSFGRGQVAMEAGANSGTVAAYAALELIRENGFRDFSDADIERFYGDLGFKGSAVEVHLSLTAAQSNAGVVAASPIDVLDVGWNRTFTNPQDTDLEVLMPTLSAKVQATETLSFSGLAYYRKFKSRVVDGNLTEVEPCPADPTLLCLDEDGTIENVEDLNGDDVELDDVVADPFGDFALGSIERIGTDSEGFGGSVQAASTAELFSRPNRFIIGASYDGGRVKYNTSSELGEIGNRFVVAGSGIIVGEPEDLAPRRLTTENDYFGVYFTNTMDVTDQFALTVGGRWNHATITLDDLTGLFPGLDTTNKYQRFNPMVGGTYEFSKLLTMYGSYSEANRAPTAAELGCAEPDNPCLIESFLTDDPPLEQVVSKTFEFGFRGQATPGDGQLFTWSAGLFRTLNVDDILNVAAEATGRGYFLNAGDTLRQGVELAAAYQNRTFSVYGSYALVDATFQNDLILPAANTPSGTFNCDDPLAPVDPDEPQCQAVSDGDTLPGIPRHRIKAGFEYWLTPQWKFGSDFLFASSQFFFGDEANNNRQLSSYTRVDLHTSYKLSENAEAYGLIRNLFDRRYGLYGTFFDTEEAEEAFEAAGYEDPTDPRSISPAQPFAIYGGLRITF